MKTAKTLVAALAVFAMYACAPAPAPAEMATAGTPADEQAIGDLFDRVEAAWNAKDSAGMLATMAENLQFITPEGEHINGRDAYAEMMTREFAMERPEGMMLSIDVGYIQWHGADVAAVGGTWSVSGLPEGVPSTGAWINVVTRHDGQWLATNSLVATRPLEMAGGN